MERIAVLGLGNWGTALARTWLAAGHEVAGWTVEQEVYDSIRSAGVNAKYLDGIDLSGMRATMKLDEAIAGAHILALALPSGVVLQVVDDLVPLLQPEHVLIDLAKGLAPDEELISESIERRLTAADLRNPLAVLSGPTIAPEVARGVLTTALVASRDRDLAGRLAERLSTPTLVLHAAADPIGAELWGGYKNVIALACGVVDGLAAAGGAGGDNLKAALFAAGFAEGRELLEALGAAPDTAFGPAGLGDLYVTATSPHGRNRQMGENLGRGMTLEQSQGEMVMVSEGVRAARLFARRARALSRATPFLDAVNALLDGDLDAATCVQRLVGRATTGS